MLLTAPRGPAPSRALGALLGLLTLTPGVSLAGEVSLTSPQTLYRGGGDITLVIRNDTRSDIVLPGCGAIVFERFEGDAFIPLPPPSCDSFGPGSTIKAGASLELKLAPRVSGLSYVRPVLTFGVGCRAGLPIEQAECRAVSSVRCRYLGYGSASLEG